MKFSLPGLRNWIIAFSLLVCPAGAAAGEGSCRNGGLVVCRPVFGSDTGWDGFFL